MTLTVPPRNWTDIHWPEIAGGAAAHWIAVLPLAATEQHGPHLPVGTDVMIAEAYLARVRELLPETVPATFLPLQPVGISTEHVDYPGTLTLPSEVALKAWMALGESVVRAGVRKIVMVTSHGGNSAAMTLVAQELRAQHGLLAVTTSWSRLSSPEKLFAAEEVRHGIHAARSKPRSCWLAIRTACAGRRSRSLSPQALRWSSDIAGFRHSAPRRSPGRRRICTRAVPSAMQRRRPQKKVNACLITALARSANCSGRSIIST
jgi:creatinine amidohydrolase/Fe(II)-dependent formamide hydrolase-like protein